MIQCNACKPILTEADQAAGPCHHCGGSIGVFSEPGTGYLDLTVMPISMVADQPEPSGKHIVGYVALSGAKSTTVKDGDRLTAEISGPVHLGRRGENRVTDLVVAMLRASGRSAEVGPGADDRGEDATLTIEGHKVTLQIVGVLHEPDFWAKVQQGSATIEIERTTDLLDRAIASKAISDEMAKRNTILAIDCGDFGPLATAATVTAYLAKYGDPNRYGFGAVWLIGPTLALCSRLGHSPW